MFRITRSRLLALMAVLVAPAAAMGQYTFQTAHNLGVIDGMGHVNGSPGQNGLVNASGTVGNSSANWFRFDVPDWRTVTIRLDSFGGPVNAGLYRSNGSFVRLLQVPAGAARIMSDTLGAGRYYIEVYKTYEAFRATTGHRLTVEGKPLINDTAGNSLARARALGTAGPTPVTIAEYVGTWDFDDYYSVNVPANSVLNVQVLSNSPAPQYDIDLQAFNAAGQVVGQSIRGGITSESVAVRVGAAQTIRFRAYHPNRTYGLNNHCWHSIRYFTAPASPLPPTNPPTLPPLIDRGGNSAAAATPVPSLFVPIVDSIGGTDQNDWYQFQVPPYNGAAFLTTRGVVTTLSGLTQPATVQLYQRIGGVPVLVAQASGGAGRNAVINSSQLLIRDINGYPVTYFIRVVSTAPISTPYTLNIVPQGV